MIFFTLSIHTKAHHSFPLWIENDQVMGFFFFPIFYCCCPWCLQTCHVYYQIICRSPTDSRKLSSQYGMTRRQVDIFGYPPGWPIRSIFAVVYVLNLSIKREVLKCYELCSTAVCTHVTHASGTTTVSIHRSTTDLINLAQDCAHGLVGHLSSSQFVESGNSTVSGWMGQSVSSRYLLPLDVDSCCWLGFFLYY